LASWALLCSAVIAISSCFLLRVDSFACTRRSPSSSPTPIALSLLHRGHTIRPFQGGVARCPPRPYRAILEK
jgi:hypothetical protein